ncbi:MAG: alpha/beta hydrolase [Gammaproteobacteria bacterium]|nr:alpha/beta hydrolase [Gammaproteobacteria bacterium]MDH4313486.1 alpha/beta hydrolase [Gammaproteobacteria bacterium]MDH5500089.1 alpha/beta hydrolase [Gammaproteobacteria bacterium]
MPLPQTVEIEPASAATGTVIWLHGLGADGHDFEPIVPELALPDSVSLRFVFPHAPVRPVTLNGGMRMRAWYDIISLDRSGPQDEAGIRASSASLLELVERERARGISNDKVVVAGFSQGGAIAMHMAMRYSQRLAGLMALSTWLPLGDSLSAEVINNDKSQPRDLPVFMAHGSFDPMLPIGMGQQSKAALESAGYTVEWHEYPMAHAVCAEEIVDIRNWLLRIF